MNKYVLKEICFVIPTLMGYLFDQKREMQKFKNQSSNAHKFRNVFFCCWYFLFYVFVLDNGSYKSHMLLSLHYTQISTNQKRITKTEKNIQTLLSKNLKTRCSQKCAGFLWINIMKRQWICVNDKGWKRAHKSWSSRIYCS